MSSHTVMNPNGGADIMRRVMEDRPLDPISVDVMYCGLGFTSGYGPMISAKRPLRTRMMGGVGRDD